MRGYQKSSRALDLFSVGGATMVIKEWGEIRQLYTDCMPRPSTLLPAWVNWCTWTIAGVFVLITLITIASIFIPANTFGLPVFRSVFDFVTAIPQTVVYVLSSLLIGALVTLIEKTYANEFKKIYMTHGLRQYPWWRRRFYLHYALFLRALTDRTPPLTREIITQLNSFADIAGPPPPPESRLLQPAYIVPFIVLLNALITEVLKQADLLKWPIGVVTLACYIGYIGLIYYVLTMSVVATTSGRVTDRTIQRFLQWAERDMPVTTASERPAFLCQRGVVPHKRHPHPS
jgi:hypothetical protein